MTHALIVVDVQNDFCEGGSLGVDGGAEVARRISAFIDEHRGDYDVVVATRDRHVDPGAHFAESPDYVDTWPAHCVAGTLGAEFHPDLDTSSVDDVFDKGAHAAAYSAFEGTDADGTTLDEYLRARGVDAVDVVGIATDHCVRATAVDANVNGYRTRVLTDLAAGVAPDTTASAIEQLQQAGVEVTTSS
jgi:nicotinamidase/pyrazinamidase